MKVVVQTFWSRRQTKVYENIDFKIVQLNYYKISLSLDSNVLPFRTFKEVIFSSLRNDLERCILVSKDVAHILLFVACF